jgi:hypothetical protein
MDQSKRNFMKMLPLVALAPIAVTQVGAHEAQVYELKADKKYVFKLPADAAFSKQEMDDAQKTLEQRGLNATLVQGDLEIYELRLDAQSAKRGSYASGISQQRNI